MMRPHAPGECPETSRLRQEFNHYKRKLNEHSSAQFEPVDFQRIQQFTSGRLDPPENRFTENQTQHDLREGIREMEDLLQSAYELR